MRVEYEISADDYVACQLLYYKLSLGRKRARRAATWILAGFFFFVVAGTDKSHHWDPFLLAVIGALSIYCGLRSLFPARYFRRAYQKTDLAGKKFKANIDEDGFEVAGDFCTWRIRWPGVRVKGENERAFMLSAANTIFMFGKRHLDEEQQRELRRLSGLQSPGA